MAQRLSSETKSKIKVTQVAAYSRTCSHPNVFNGYIQHNSKCHMNSRNEISQATQHAFR